MSDLLNDSPTAVKLRDRVLSELGSDEGVLFVTEGQVMEPLGGTNFNLLIGAIIVTQLRLLVFETKALGRSALHAASWRDDVERSGRHEDGSVLIQKGGSRPIWKIQVWEGKSYKTPLDRKRLDMLSLAIEEARSALGAEREAEVADEYEQIRRRRGF